MRGGSRFRGIGVTEREHEAVRMVEESSQRRMGVQERQSE
jgi:hypothetical protein